MKETLLLVPNIRDAFEILTFCLTFCLAIAAFLMMLWYHIATSKTCAFQDAADLLSINEIWALQSVYCA